MNHSCRISTQRSMSIRMFHVTIEKQLKYRHIKNLVCLLVFSLFLVSCNRSPKTTFNETPTRGNIKIGVDESFRLLMDTQLFTFTSLYTYATITPIYKNEFDVIEDFMKDSVRTIVTARKLTENELEFLKGKSIIARTETIAIDAIAFIVNKSNPDSLIQIGKIKQLFSGTLKDWKDINKKNKSGKIEVVFDNKKSANSRYFAEKLNISQFPDNFYTAQTNEEVINHVEKHKNAIGIISVNWISENTDSTSNKFLSKIKVVGLTSEIDPEGLYYYRPYPAYIADESYPFIRKVYMINRETFLGLGSGFVAFVKGEKGQRIVLKAGLVPATMPVRLVEIKNN
jgi:phosphate transport system substrate-binding protein